MKIKFGLTVKIFFFILTSSILLFFGVAQFMGYNFKNMAIKDAKQLTDAYVKKYARLISAQLDVDFEAARTTSYIMKEYDIKHYSSQRIVYNNLLRCLLEENPLYTSVWDSWELSATDSNWNKTYGRISTAYYRTADDISITIDSLNIEGDDVNSLYYQLKTTQQEAITKPYFYSYTKFKSDEILETSIVVPIFKDTSYVGIVGMDVALDKFYNFIDSIHPFRNSYAFILDNDASFIAHPNKKLTAIPITDIDSVNTKQFSILERVKKGENFQYTLKNIQGQDSVYVTFAPIVISKTTTPWSMAIVVPLQTIYDDINDEYKIATIVGIIGLILLFIVILVISLSITIPLKRTSKSLLKLEKGEVDYSAKIPVKTSDEIGEMADSVNTLIDGLKSITDFASEIGKGNFEAQFSQLSEEDRLGKSILEMQKSLNKANEEENKRKLKENHLNWTSRGIAKFSEILRYNNDDFEMFIYNIMSNIVSYLDANQGGLYVINDTDENDVYFELRAAVGFEKKKKDQKRVDLNEGYVGRCVLEKEKIFVSEVPDDYVKITSGLGKEKPGSLLFIPLKLNNEVLGVIEIESFNILENYQIEFVEKISESIASTIYNLKINLRTAQLLEQSQNRAEELEQQEEEMRQNMEEMQATQEEANKREKEMLGLIDAIKETMLVAEYDLQGRVIDMNKPFLNLYGLSAQQMKGKVINASNKFEDEKKQAEYNKFWQDLQRGETKQKIQYIKSKEKESWVLETYTPVISQQGKTIKIINIAIDITEQEKKKAVLAEIKQKKKKSKLSEKQIEANKKTLSQDFNFEHVDLNPMKKLYNNNLSSIKKVVNVFIKTVPEHIEELKNLYEDNNLGNLGIKVANLKAKLKYFGLKALVEKTNIIEKNTKEKTKRKEIPKLINELSELWQLVEKELTVISKL